MKKPFPQGVTALALLKNGKLIIGTGDGLVTEMCAGGRGEMAINSEKLVALHHSFLKLAD